MFDKLLIANRGEIACRIIATCRRLGITSAAVYSDADAQARHVRLADEAWRLGPASPRESYLNIDRVLQAAKSSGAQAIHPGYGFLSENPLFAQRIAEAGLIFVGPPVGAMQAMSSKATARDLMLRAGVPVLPGYQGERQTRDWLRSQAAQIGYPVLIKAVAGGGGKGMRVVADDAGFEASLAACQREAQASFADARVLLEKYLPAPRHIEVQVFGDQRGSIVHLFERDCSAQRRHQKVLEESLAPHLSEVQRAALTQAACEAARAVGYTGAGTVEFLFDSEGHHYFIEMNTRIQVEHAVTEMIVGVDLVEWQLRVAAGEPLPRTQTEIHARGHAIEARLYAEQPEVGFLPSSGCLRQFDLPPVGARGGVTLRIETGVTAGDRIGIDYDAMLAKVIVHAASRDEAIAGLDAALGDTRVTGVGSNLAFLRRLLASAAFQTGSIDTDYVERELSSLLPAASTPATMPTRMAAVAAALFLIAQERSALSGGRDDVSGTRPTVQSPWLSGDGWRLNASLRRSLQFEMPATSPASAPAQVAVELEYRRGGLWIWREGTAEPAQLLTLGEDLFVLQLGAHTQRLRILKDAGGLHIVIGSSELRLRWRDPLNVQVGAQADEASLAAPMPGRIVALLSSAGAHVTRGAALLVMEAMKMEHTLCAPANGIVRGYRAQVGEQVQEGTLLVNFEAAAEPRS